MHKLPFSKDSRTANGDSIVWDIGNSSMDAADSGLASSTDERPLSGVDSLVNQVRIESVMS